MAIRKPLQDFVKLQEEILKEDDYKQDWSYCPNHSLLVGLKRELEELEEALIDGDKDGIRKECADVANYAMMIADNNNNKD